LQLQAEFLFKNPSCITGLVIYAYLKYSNMRYCPPPKVKVNMKHKRVSSTWFCSC